MSFQRAFQWYHSHADPIWPDGTFKQWFLKSLQYLLVLQYIFIWTAGKMANAVLIRGTCYKSKTSRSFYLDQLFICVKKFELCLVTQSL